MLVLNREPDQSVLRPRDGRNGSLAPALPALPVSEGTIFATDPDDGFKTVFYHFAGTRARPGGDRGRAAGDCAGAGVNE